MQRRRQQAGLFFDEDIGERAVSPPGQRRWCAT
jgi:hypothetical protein